jgi:hypothetical protein
MSDYERINPAQPAFRELGIGFATNPGCVQCQGVAGLNRRHGKALTGPLRGLSGWMCARCKTTNTAKTESRAAT